MKSVDKVFLVINTSYFGDTLLTGPLCQNIKLQYPHSHIIFMANKPFVEAAKFSKGVDEVIAYDKKREHRGIRGAVQFYREHRQELTRYGKLDAAFVIYGNERGILLAKLLGAQKILADNPQLINLLVDNPRHLNYGKITNVANRHSLLLHYYNKQPVQNLPMKYVPSIAAQAKAKQLLAHIHQDMIALCTVSKKVEKDMPLDTCLGLINSLQAQGKAVVFLGAGKPSADYARQLKAAGAQFVDLTDKTTIAELGAVLQLCQGLISVDTGTMHLGLATGVPTVCLFYITTHEHLASWAPDERLYHCKVLSNHISDSVIIREFNKLLI